MKRIDLARAIAPIFVVVVALAPRSRAQTTELTSVSTGGVQGSSSSESASITSDGRHVAFESLSPNLVPGDTNARYDIFVRDRLMATTERVSLASNAAQGNHHSRRPSISADGRLVAFESGAFNLVVGDTNLADDIFVRDRLLGTTERVSVNSSGVQGNWHSDHPSISADGRYVAFESVASNLVAGDTNSKRDVFVRDRQAGTTERISVSSSGGQANAHSSYAAMSSDGRCVAFQSDASNLVSGDTNLVMDVFVRDRQAGTTERVSVGLGGAQGSAESDTPQLSADGRFAAFQSRASNLVAGDTNAAWDVFVRDRQSGTTERVSLGAGGTEADADSHGLSVALAHDGRWVAFASDASNLVLGDTNGRADIFVRDRQSGTTERASVTSAGAQGNDASYYPALSFDARFVVFASSASNFAPGDMNTVSDVFTRDRGLLYPGLFCTAGTTTNGCVASIASAGSPSASSGSGFTLSAANVEGQELGILFYGTSGAQAVTWYASSGFLCVKEPTQRTGAQNSGGTSNACDGALSLDWNRYIAANPTALGGPFVVGQHVFVQAWFHDPPNPKTSMLSNGIEFVVGP